MREILFRGKDIYGKWLYGDLINLTNEIKQICNHTQLEHAHSVDIKTIGQYTGLTDKNGTKIFEGDILRENYHPENDTEVVYEDGSFHFKALHGNYGMYIKGCLLSLCFKQNATNRLKIIGNVHDNPELLGGGMR